jgi:8-oxo-dGTP pyrophosphatase MutT (NUDIX family)
MVKNTLYCGNCGKYGHAYRKCLAPIISYGIIIFKKIDNKLKYLLVQRKDTLGFVEFMRGKYNLENINYIIKLFKIMTLNERLEIVSNNFDTLWNKLWMDQDNKQYHNEYETSKKKFNLLKNGLNVKNNYVSLLSIHKNTEICWLEPEWGFPKGRRNLKETNLDCAKREFEEESGIKKNEYNIIYQIDPLEELFSGSNNIRYKHIYYIAMAKDNINNDFTIDTNNFNQVSEIRSIKWHTFVESMNIIRKYNMEKRNVLEKLHNILIK